MNDINILYYFNKIFFILGNTKRKAGGGKNVSDVPKSTPTRDTSGDKNDNDPFVPDTCPPTPRKTDLAKAKRKSDLVSSITYILFI